MESLKDLFNKYGHTDKHTKHTYDGFYEKWFSHLRDKPINLLEIGVSSYGGGDLLAFAEYFPNGIIHGLDNEVNILLPEVMTVPNIKIYDGDAYSKDAVNKVPQIKFDIIIDDCVHNHKSHVILVKSFYPMLADDGIYVIEDVNASQLELYKKEKVKDFYVEPEIFDMVYLRPKRKNNILVRYNRVLL